jgi:hypothetical protein
MKLIQKLIYFIVMIFVWPFAKLYYLWTYFYELYLNKHKRPKYKLFLSHSWGDDLYDELEKHFKKCGIKFKNFSISKNMPLDIETKSFLQLDYELFYLIKQCDIFVVHSDQKASNSISNGKWMRIEAQHAHLLGTPILGVVDDESNEPSEEITGICHAQTSLKSYIVGKYLNFLYENKKAIIAKTKLDDYHNGGGGVWEFGKFTANDSSSFFYKIRGLLRNKNERDAMPYYLVIQWLSQESLRGDNMAIFEAAMDKANESVFSLMVSVQDKDDGVEWTYYIADGQQWSSIFEEEVKVKLPKELINITFAKDIHWRFHLEQYKNHKNNKMLSSKLKRSR